MAEHSLWQRRKVTLEELTALCDEIAALVRAGVPLETALAQIAEDMPSRLRAVSAELSARLERGEDFATALRSTKDQFPEYFAAMVEAGVQSGRLAVALEGMADSGRRILEVRRSIVLAMLYPAFLFYFAYLLFVLFVVRSAAMIGQFYDALGLRRSWLTDLAVAIGNLDWYWLLLLPLGVLLLSVLWARRTSRAQLLQSRGAGWTLNWLGSARRIMLLSRFSTFAEILALLFEQRMPAPVAVRLAAAASGDDRLQQTGDAMAGAIERGESGRDIRDLPPLLRWLVVGCASLSQSSPAAMVRGLRQAAQDYRYAAQQQTDWLRLYLPATVTVVIGGAIAFAYALTALLPWWRLLYEMADYESMMM